MKHFLLCYRTAADYLERRAQYRGDHLRLAWEAVERGELLLGGALSDPPDGAVLLFVGETASAAEAFARADPYVRNGLVESWHVREWSTVVGPAAAAPLRLGH